MYTYRFICSPLKLTIEKYFYTHSWCVKIKVKYSIIAYLISLQEGGKGKGWGKSPEKASCKLRERRIIKEVRESNQHIYKALTTKGKNKYRKENKDRYRFTHKGL